MKRLIEKTVFCGLVTAWRLAIVPTRRSPEEVNATTDGVVLPPSAFSMTVGSPPSNTAMHEFVVPRSMPIDFPIRSDSFMPRNKSKWDCRRFLGIGQIAVERVPAGISGAAGGAGGGRRGLGGLPRRLGAQRQFEFEAGVGVVQIGAEALAQPCQAVANGLGVHVELVGDEGDVSLPAKPRQQRLLPPCRGRAREAREWRQSRGGQLAHERRAGMEREQTELLARNDEALREHAVAHEPDAAGRPSPALRDRRPG